MSQPADSPPAFEEALKELEETVRRLDQGDLPLEESIALFQRGVELARHCERLLEEAELKVHELMPEERLADPSLPDAEGP